MMETLKSWNMAWTVMDGLLVIAGCVLYGKEMDERHA